MSTQSQTFNLCEVHSETKRLLRVNSSYSLTFCSLFWLPTYTLLILYPDLHSYLSKLNPIFSTILPVSYSIFFLLLFIAFVGVITYSSFHGFYGRTSTLVSDIKSLSSSFLPLLSSFVVSQLLACLVIFAFGLFGFLICKLLDINDVSVIYESEYFSWNAIFVVLLVAACVISLQVNWYLAFVISVVESRWGYESLRRSAHLIKGKKMMAFSLIILLGLLGGCFVWQYWIVSSGYFILYWTMLMLTIIMRYSLAATVVMYIYCMKMHGELRMEIVDEEIADPDYVRLPRDDDGC